MRIVFPKHVVRVEYKTFCVSCKKRLKRVLKYEMFDYGFHDLAASMAKKRKELEAQAKRHADHGDCCGPCVKWCNEQGNNPKR